MPKAALRSNADRGEETRRKILDAAESLFAERGFHGVSLRDITTLAKVENALASYHFKVKDHLISAVVLRRAEEHRFDLVNSLEATILARKPGLPTNLDLVKAYARPALEKIARGPGWAAYIKIIVGIQNLDRNNTVSLLTNSIYDDTIRLFVTAFERANPGVPKRSVQFSLYFLHGAFIHILSQGRTFERLIDDAKGFQDPAELLEELANSFAFGLDGKARARAQRS